MNKSGADTPKQELLDYLAGKSGLLYLSDLRSSRLSEYVLSALAVTVPFDFPVREWNQAIVYILSQEAGFQDPEEAKNYLVEQIKKRRNS